VRNASIALGGRHDHQEPEHHDRARRPRRPDRPETDRARRRCSGC
jgi:hypothetical protein